MLLTAGRGKQLFDAHDRNGDGIIDKNDAMETQDSWDSSDDEKWTAKPTLNIDEFCEKLVCQLMEAADFEEVTTSVNALSEEEWKECRAKFLKQCADVSEITQRGDQSDSD